ncbi:MAG: PspC domain-containing protein [Treponema sp.]|nr:PspC domain-containing protein [Treponema sp.]MBR4790537.1 PspC domain-containing protein [Treponema sp.]MBR5032920.1 PspC domain-containing protein [Treponema sp.]
MKKLKKSNNKIICGVCGGIADYFNIDATIVRILLVILSCLWGSGIIIYIAAALVMPPADMEDLNNDNIDNLKSANVNGEEGAKASKSSSKATEKSGEDVPHSDAEFDSYFKK